MTQAPRARKQRVDTLYCSFCGKSQHEVRKLIAGLTVFVCDECIDLCVQIVLEKVPDGEIPSYFRETLKSANGRDLLNTILVRLDSDPLYSIAELSVNQTACFYLGPFVEPFNTIYADHVKPIIEAREFAIKRADEIFGSRAIMHDIWEGIFCSRFIIADVTGKNPNVMYEIGLAHAMGKPVVMLTQSIDDVPFDLRHFRCLVYDYTPKGCEALEAKLEKTVDALKTVEYRLTFKKRR